MNRATATGVMIFAALVWGFAFIPQKTAMEVMGPFTFLAARFLVGGLAILPLVAWEGRRNPRPLSRRDWQLLGLMVIAFLLGSWLQQEGLRFTTATNGGFLTGLYVLFVPLIALLFLRHPLHWIVWVSTPMALLGVFLLNGARLDALNSGDIYIIACAFFWAIQVLMLGVLARSTGRPILVSAITFLAVGALSTIGAFSFETATLEAFQLGWVQLAYAAIMSTAIGFTCQAIAQQHLPPANAAIIMSAEALFAALGGAVLLGERLTALGYAGAALIFLAIVLVETVPLLRRHQSAEAKRDSTVERHTTI